MSADISESVSVALTENFPYPPVAKAYHPCAPSNSAMSGSVETPDTDIERVPYGTGITPRNVDFFQTLSEIRQRVEQPSFEFRIPSITPSLAVYSVPSSNDSFRRYTFSVSGDEASGNSSE
jgi:hypothetical protein